MLSRADQSAVGAFSPVLKEANWICNRHKLNHCVGKDWVTFKWVEETERDLHKR